jgi:hypothetical protein
MHKHLASRRSVLASGLAAGAAIAAPNVARVQWSVRSRPPLSINADGFIFSKAAFDKLPKDLQQILTATLEERYRRRTFDCEHKEELTLRKAIQQLGVHPFGFRTMSRQSSRKQPSRCSRPRAPRAARRPRAWPGWTSSSRTRLCVTPRALTHSRRARVGILAVGLHQYYQTPAYRPVWIDAWAQRPNALISPHRFRAGFYNSR